MKALLLVIVALLPLPAFAASFDCAKASTIVEKLICSDKAVSALDSELSAKYKAVLAATSDKQPIKAQQAAWLAQTRNKCGSAACLSAVYESRISALADTSNNTTVTGVIRTGSLDSAIELPNGDSIGFMADSQAAKKILASCKEGDTCKVSGTVESSDGFSTFKTVSMALAAPSAASSGPVASDLHAAHANSVAALGFNKSVLSSYLYLQRDLVNPPSKFTTFESFLAALFENPLVASVTPLRTSDGAIGVRWKLKGVPAGGVFFDFEDGEAHPVSYLDGGRATQIETAQDSYVVSIAILQLIAPAAHR